MSSTSSEDGNALPARDILKTLLKDPKHKALILQMLKNSPERRSSPIPKKLRLPPKCESPTALCRRRALEEMTRNDLPSSSASDTSESGESIVTGPKLPFDQLLKGVIAFVDVRKNNEDRSSGIKAIMRSMGATVLEEFTKQVTHVVYKDGDYMTYEKSRLLGIHLVSVLWLDAIRKHHARVPEKRFPPFGRNIDSENASALCSQFQKDYDDIILDEKLNRKSCSTLSTKTSSLSLKDRRNTTFFRSSVSASSSVKSLANKVKPIVNEPDGDLTSDDSDCGVINGSPVKKKQESTILLEQSPQITEDGSSVHAPSEITEDGSTASKESKSKSKKLLLRDSDATKSGLALDISNQSVSDATKNLSMSSLRLSETDRTKSGLGPTKTTESLLKTTSNITNNVNRTKDTSHAMSSLRLSDSVCVEDGKTNANLEFELFNISSKNTTKNTDDSRDKSSARNSPLVKGTPDKGKPLAKHVTVRKNKKVRNGKQGEKAQESDNELKEAEAKTQSKPKSKSSEPLSDCSVENNESPEESPKSNADNLKTLNKNTPAVRKKGVVTNTKGSSKSKCSDNESDGIRSTKKPKNLKNRRLTKTLLSEESGSDSTPDELWGALTKPVERRQTRSWKPNAKTTSKSGSKPTMKISTASSDSEVEEASTLPIKKRTLRNLKPKPKCNTEPRKSDTSSEESHSQTAKTKIDPTKKKAPGKITSDIDTSTHNSSDETASDFETPSTVQKNKKAKTPKTDSKCKQPEKITSTPARPANKNQKHTSEDSSDSSLSKKKSGSAQIKSANKRKSQDSINETPDKRKRVIVNKGLVKSIDRNENDVLEIESDEKKTASKVEKSSNPNKPLFKTPAKPIPPRKDTSSVAKKTTCSQAVKSKRMLYNPSDINPEWKSSSDDERERRRRKNEITKKMSPTGTDRVVAALFPSQEITTPKMPKYDELLNEQDSNDKQKAEFAGDLMNLLTKKNADMEKEMRAKKKQKPSVEYDSDQDEQRELLDLLKRNENRRRSVRVSSQQTERPESENQKPSTRTTSRKTTYKSSSSVTSDSDFGRYLSPVKRTPVRRSTMDFEAASSSQRSTKSYKRKDASMVVTKFHREEVFEFEKIVRKLGKFFTELVVTDSTTHLVAADAKRTVNILRALARGCWILKKEYLTKSSAAGRWLDEEAFEMTEFSPAVKECRIQRQAFGPKYTMDLFKHCGNIFISKGTQPKSSELRELIRTCKGSVTHVKKTAKIAIGAYIASEEVTSVTETWLLDSIQENKLQPLKNYLIKPSGLNSPHF